MKFKIPVADPTQPLDVNAIVSLPKALDNKEDERVVASFSLRPTASACAPWARRSRAVKRCTRTRGRTCLMVCVGGFGS